MAQRNPNLRRTGSILFSVAILFGVLLTIVKAEPDFEATMYGFTIFHYPRLTSFHCPVLMTSQDRQNVTARLSNRLDRPISWYVNSQFSSESAIISTDERIDLQPGERKEVVWEVGNENVVLGYYIFAYTLASSVSTPPRLESTCGTLVLKLPFKGGPIIFYDSLILAIMGAAIGWILWSRHADMGDAKIVSQTLWMRFMTVLVTVCVILSLFISWFLALLLVFVAFLASIVYLTQNKA